MHTLGTMTRLFARLLGILALLVLPFVVLIRGSVYLHEHHHFFPSLALVGGVSLTFVLLFLYVTFFFGMGRKRVSMRQRLALIFTVLAGYCGYGLLYVSSDNVKSPEIQNEFRALHPILRMGVSTLLLLDRDLVITDADRLPEDYKRMGLQTKQQSLHYRQSDGYVHAMDIRTHGRSSLRNFLTKWYFRGMGFNVLRHGGTGDHLHISLLSHDRPHAY